MKEYELTVLMHPDLEMNLDPSLTKIRGIITDAGGEITKEENWGKKKLAYEIRKQEFAVYMFFEVNLPPAAPSKISSILNITDEAIRYLLVTKDLKKPEAESKDGDEEEKESDPKIEE